MTSFFFNSSILIPCSSSSVSNYDNYTYPHVSFPFRKHANCRCAIRAVQDGAAGILSPNDVVDDVSVAQVEVVEEEEKVQSTPRKRVSKKKQEDVDDDDTRFKLRNGREVGVFFSSVFLMN